MDRILSEWISFAATLTPAARGMEESELQDWGRSILEAVADDMEKQQTDRERKVKSRGNLAEESSAITESAHGHAMDRLTHGFTLSQLIAEYRALRATVIRLWSRQLEEETWKDCHELIRFGEAVDQSLTQSVELYSRKLEQARQLFIGVLGHDLRSPLGAITSGAEGLLITADELGDRQVRMAVGIRNSAGRIRRMVDDLLDFTRTRLGQGLPINPVRMDVREVIHEVRRELEVRRPACRLRQEFEGTLVGEWDRDRLQQLLLNLVDNAARYRQEGTPVSVFARENDEEVVISVHNEGPPIPSSQQKTLFDPLVRGALHEAEQVIRHDGLGLGLYIARQIAEAHHGSISVSSSEAEGTTFEVRLPQAGVPLRE